METVINSTNIRTCPECGLELAGENAICACDSSLPEGPIQIRDPLLGTILNGTYEIQDAIGRGGMGVVYKARDILMERTVAIKMLHAHLARDQQSVQRFKQEARAASAMNHNNVITVFDFGISENHQPFLIMDYIQGRSLSTLIDEAKGLPHERAVHIFAQVCDALHAAHSKGVIHRDLKPSNIMIVQTRDDPDFVKIVDFGIAKLLPSSGKQAQNLTQTGELFGSPLYMSPEQFLGKRLDERTDIYAMGCVMYEALIGKPPFTGEHVLETMYKHINEPPVKFSAARPDLKIPPKLEAIVMRALEKDEDQRFQKMAELRDTLLLTMEGAKDTRSLGARLQAIRSKLKRARKRNMPIIKKLGYGVLGTGLIGCFCYLILWLTQGNEDSQWVALFKDAQDAYRRGQLTKAQDKFLQAAKKAKELYDMNSEKYLETLKRLAWVYEEEEKYAEARKIISKVKELSPEKQMQFKAAQLLAYAPVSQMENLKNEKVTKGPEAGLKAGIKALEPYIGPADPGLLKLYKSLAETYEIDKHYAEAEDARIKLVSIREDSQGPESVGVAEARVALANLYVEWGKDVMAKGAYADAERTFAEAKDSYDIAIKLYDQLIGFTCPEIAPTKKKLAECVELQAEAKKKMPADAATSSKDDSSSF